MALRDTPASSPFISLFLAALLAGCGKSGPAPGPTGSASAAASASATPNTYGIPIGVPTSPEKIVAAVNPKHLKPYDGPKGTLKGTVRIEGDPPPDTGLKFPDRCKDSAATYGKLFRVGLDRALADAMVAVTDYADRGFVPARDEAIKIAVHRCVPAKRTYALTFGQRVEVSNIDQTESYLPNLDGAPARTIMVATPGGDPVKLFPGSTSPAHYMLRDQLGSGLVADVFVVNYATIDVTGLDGQYQIKDIPVGPVRVDVFLPVISKSEGQKVDIKEGDNTLDLTFHFDASKDDPGRKPAGLEFDAGAPAAKTPKPAPAGSAKRRILP